MLNVLCFALAFIDVVFVLPPGIHCSLYLDDFAIYVSGSYLLSINAVVSWADLHGLFMYPLQHTNDCSTLLHQLSLVYRRLHHCFPFLPTIRPSHQLFSFLGDSFTFRFDVVVSFLRQTSLLADFPYIPALIHVLARYFMV